MVRESLRILNSASDVKAIDGVNLNPKSSVYDKKEVIVTAIGANQYIISFKHSIVKYLRITSNSFFLHSRTFFL